MPVVLDVGGQEGEISPELLACLTVVSPNETELARITGMPTDTEAQIGAAAGLLFSKGIETVLVKLGAKGSLLLRGAGGRLPGHPPTCLTTHALQLSNAAGTVWVAPVPLFKSCCALFPPVF